MPADAEKQPLTYGFSETTRGIASLIILIHLFCVAVALLGNESASELRNRLAAVLGPYTRLLNIDLGFTAGFHLTHATEYEDDHQLVIQWEGEQEPVVFPKPTRGWSYLTLGFREQRWRLLAQRLGILVSDENDDAIAELGRAIGEAMFAETDRSQLVFRCRRLRPSELASNVDYSPSDDATYETLYDADVFQDSQGLVRIHKRVQADEAAPVQNK